MFISSTKAQNINYDAFNTSSTIDTATATACLTNLTREAFGINKLITILDCNITKEPGFTILTNQMAILHKYAEKNIRSFEITNGTRNTFPSFETCIANCDSKVQKKRVYKKKFNTLRKNQIYLVFIDSIADYEANMFKIQTMVPYNMSAEFFLFYTNVPNDTRATALEILQIAFDQSKFTTKLIIPIERDVFYLYNFNLYPKEKKYCAAHPMLTLINTCYHGVFTKRVYRNNYDFSRLNCTIPVIMMEIPPFVITPNDGLEVLILKEFERRLNVTFEKSMNSMSGSWGMKQPNGTWSGLLEQIYIDPFNIGVGAVSLKEDRLIDFDYTTDYFSESMLFVVPTADRVEEWKLIMIIFSWSTWLVLFILFVVISVLIWIASNVEELVTADDRNLTTFGSAMLLSLQVAIAFAVDKQPRALANRMLFITYALFIIIVSCLYQSALIDILTNPQYQHQIKTYEEVVDASIPLGGSSEYREIFNESDKVLYDKYVILSGENAVYQVAKGAFITISGEFYVKFISGTPEVTHQDGTSKIYVIYDDVVYIDTFRIVFSKNYVLKKQFDDIIDGLLTAGFIAKWTQYYTNQYRPADWKPMDYEKSTSNDVVLTMRHFEGSFALLLFGLVCGLITFGLELILYKFNKEKRRYLIQRRWKKILVARRVFNRRFLH